MDVKNRILHIVPSVGLESSGPTYVVLRLCAEQIALGRPVTLATLDWPSPPRAIPYLETFPLGLGPRRLGRSPAMNRWLKGEVASGAISILHNHGMWQLNSLYAGWARRGNKNTRLVISPHGMLSKWAFHSGSIAKRLFWPLLQRPVLAGADCFHATADSERVDIRRMGFTQPIAVIPNGIDLAETEAKRAINPRTLLFLGRLHPVKGLDLLLSAWSELQGRFPDWRLRVVGSDHEVYGKTGYDRELKSIAQGMNLARVDFSGELLGLDKLEAYREAELFVLPSRTENFGVAVAEALAAGTPAVVSKGAPWGGLEENGCGWWIDLSKAALVDTLAKAMSLSHGQLEKMGQMGRAWMVRDFSWNRIGSMMSQTYDWLAGLAPPPTFVSFE